MAVHPSTIADGGSANGTDWTVNNEIVSGATLNFSGLGKVSAAGGVMNEFTHPDTAKREKQHVWPIAVPDGKYVAFAIWYGNLDASQIAIVRLSDGRVSELGIKGIRPLAVLDGRLVYLQSDGTVMAVAARCPKGSGHRRIRSRSMIRCLSSPRTTATRAFSSRQVARWLRHAATC